MHKNRDLVLGTLKLLTAKKIWPLNFDDRPHLLIKNMILLKSFSFLLGFGLWWWLGNILRLLGDLLLLICLVPCRQWPQMFILSEQVLVQIDRGRYRCLCGLRQGWSVPHLRRYFYLWCLFLRSSFGVDIKNTRTRLSLEEALILLKIKFTGIIRMKIHDHLLLRVAPALATLWRADATAMKRRTCCRSLLLRL